MASFFTHRCKRCGYEVETSGPHEFYRDEKGEIRWYGHPEPVSKEAERAGVYGLYQRCYCAKCDKYFDHVVLEFPSPVIKAERGSIWSPSTLKKAKANRLSPKCPDCGNAAIVFDKSDVGCPRCKRGRLVRDKNTIKLSMMVKQ